MTWRTRLTTAALVCIAALASSITPAGANHGAEFFDHPWLYSSSSRFNVPFYINDNFPLAWRDRVRNGFQQWNGRNQNLLWVEPSTIGPYDVKNPCAQPYQRNGIFLGTEDGSGGFLARTYTCYLGDGRMSVAGINYDSAENWYTGTGTPASNQIDMWSVSTHETGHMSGFAGHWDGAATICVWGSGDPYHTMCPSYVQGTTVQRTLETHEITAFEARY